MFSKYYISDKNHFQVCFGKNVPEAFPKKVDLFSKHFIKRTQKKIIWLLRIHVLQTFYETKKKERVPVGHHDSPTIRIIIICIQQALLRGTIYVYCKANKHV